MNSLYNFVRENQMLALIDTVKLKRNFTLNLSNYEIESVPPLIFTFEHGLLRLFLNCNKLSKLPAEIETFQSLNTLTLDYNNLTELPSSLFTLKNLINLNISYNPISVLSPEIGLLTRLEVLWCNSTGLRSLPGEIGDMKNLDTLGARGNEIKCIPEEITNLQKLRWLTLENNCISDLPQDFSKLDKLIHLNLKGNEFSEFPNVLCSTVALQYCFLNKNRISSIDLTDLSKLFHLKMLEMSDNPVSSIGIGASDNLFPFLCMRTDWMPPDNDGEVITDSSEEDWEHSIPSSMINSTELSDNEWDDNDAVIVMLPDVSRFATIC